jgi:hypothetical protein
MTTAFLITSCTDRKRGVVASSLRAGALTARSSDGRVHQWVRRLEAAGAGRSTAYDTYVGEHWFVARNAAPMTSGLFVVSAGYGLIAADDRIHPYAATFTRRHADAVGGSAVTQRQWWKGITEWAGPSGTRASLAELADQGVLLIAASSNYLTAIAPDIEAIHPERAIVLSAGSTPNLLPEHRVPVTGRVRTTIGGSMMSTNIRLAERLLQEFGQSITRTAAVNHLTALEAGSAPLPVFRRTALADENAVRRQIDRYLTGPGPHSATAGLKWLRSEGMACEQSKFARIFRSYVTGDTRT